MSFTAPRSWVAGEVVTAALLNTHVRDNLKAVSEWNTIAFNAASFTASSGSWTVAGANVPYNKYVAGGKLMHWIGNVTASVVTGTPTYLLVLIPAGSFVSASSWAKMVAANDGGVLRDAIVIVYDATHIGITRADGAPWAASAASAFAWNFAVEIA